MISAFIDLISKKSPVYPVRTLATEYLCLNMGSYANEMNHDETTPNLQNISEPTIALV